MSQPGSYCRDAVFNVGEGWMVDGFGGEVQLGVVSVTVEIQVEVADDVTKGKDVTDEEKGTKDRALGDTLCDRGEAGGVVRKGDELLSVGEVGGEPVECGALNTLLAQPMKEVGVIDCIKGCAEV